MRQSAFGGRWRHIEHVCRFLYGQSAKCAKLDDSGQVRVGLFQAIERVIQREDGHLVRRRYLSRLVDRHALHTAAPLARAATPGVIDQDPAHDLRRDTKEVRSILPIDLPLIDEPQVHLMNERRRLQGVVGPLATKLAGRNATELRIDERQQLIECTAVAATPLAEQRRDVA